MAVLKKNKAYIYIDMYIDMYIYKRKITLKLEADNCK